MMRWDTFREGLELLAPVEPQHLEAVQLTELLRQRLQLHWTIAVRAVQVKLLEVAEAAEALG